MNSNGDFVAPSYYVAISHLFCQSLSIVLHCGGQLLNLAFSFLSSRCIRWPGFVPISFLSLFHRGRVAGLSMLHKVYSNSNHCLFCELPSLPLEFELRPQLIHWTSKYQGLERPNLQGVSCRPRFECGMTFPTLCLILECWMVASLSCGFFSFPWRRCLCGCESNL